MSHHQGSSPGEQRPDRHSYRIRWLMEQHITAMKVTQASDSAAMSPKHTCIKFTAVCLQPEPSPQQALEEAGHPAQDRPPDL